MTTIQKPGLQLPAPQAINGGEAVASGVVCRSESPALPAGARFLILFGELIALLLLHKLHNLLVLDAEYFGPHIVPQALYALVFP